MNFYLLAKLFHYKKQNFLKHFLVLSAGTYQSLLSLIHYCYFQTKQNKKNEWSRFISYMS